MSECALCHAVSPAISQELGACLRCIRERPADALSVAYQAHIKSRAAFGLPKVPPENPEGILCNLCVNACRIPQGERGYCGIRFNEGGHLIGISSEEGKLSWYHDPLPTNCVADWVCPGGTGAGYPQYALSPGPEYGSRNLAVFFHACSFNCLYCQNWHFREEHRKPKTASVEDLLSSVDEKTTCICYFGGDPASQLPFSLEASRRALNMRRGRILRLCWETNGSMSGELLQEVVDLALESGGCIKFDLKAWDENLHKALTGVTNQRTMENFSLIGKRTRSRAAPPLLIASTLLVPGYIDEVEIRKIARFIASLDPDIPYSLLAFCPRFYMSDMPLTSRALAEACRKVAQGEGLRNVRIGNLDLLTG